MTIDPRRNPPLSQPPESISDSDYNPQQPVAATATTFKPIISVQDFFNNYNSLPMFESHSLEQSPCRPIIGCRSDDITGDIIDKDENVVSESSYPNTIYYCKLHPELGSVFLGEIELHCREKEPDLHRTEILRLMKGEESTTIS